ncbi:MAG: Flp pilus assembly complex ATPase component TadA [Acidimicrobiaceae bacterium]|nr:Flp pilus assembly complex ATPase component TadA [Acidimicrobiaceae bacterium]
MSPLGRAIIAAGLVSEDQMKAAVEEARATQVSLNRVLVARKLVDERTMAEIMAKRLGLELVDLSRINLDPTAVSAIPNQLAKKHEILPIAWKDSKLVVAMADSSDLVALDDVRTITQRELIVVIATRSDLIQTIERSVRFDDALDATSQAAADQVADTDTSALTVDVIEDAPIVKLVNITLAQAVQQRASDIHIEPGEDEVRIRLRIDGVLHEVNRFPKVLLSGIVSRLKIMANLNIAERRVPQDGRMSGTLAGQTVDMRLATMPTVAGEKIVIRILDKSTALLELGQLGFMKETLDQYEACFRRPYGTILVTGPTGSGKSTTLYATLNQINHESRNLITVEDPVEYRLPGVTQVQVNTKAGLTFASALRSILRSDPDIILVGEIRDQETAIIAIEAALTGHLVLSSVHTNDSVSTPSRLVEMGIAPYLIASSLDCIVAQRLTRKLCDSCKVAYTPTLSELRSAHWPEDKIPPPEKAFKAGGCPRCAGTGFLGRFGLHEVLIISEEIEHAIAEGARTDTIRQLAKASNMQTMKDVGLYHVSLGNTSLEEILRVVS